jgi:hypothetical protein
MIRRKFGSLRKCFWTWWKKEFEFIAKFHVIESEDRGFELISDEWKFDPKEKDIKFEDFHKMNF